MLTIGEFSRICLVTRKTLRHYDRIGLLVPEMVGENGYRYYTSRQLRPMLLIKRLKEYGFSLPEIASLLEQADDASLSAALLQKRRDLEAELRERGQVLGQIGRDLERLRRNEDIMEFERTVAVTELEPVKIYSIREKMGLDQFDAQFGRVYAEAAQKGLQIAGPPVSIYHGEDFDPAHSDIEVGVPVRGDAPGVRELAGGLHAVATHVGPYDENFSAVYAAVAKWVDKNGYRTCGAPFDRYLRGYADEGLSPDAFVTEVYYPVEKVK